MSVAALRRKAWWALLGLSVIHGLFGLGDIQGGIAFSATTAPVLTGRTIAELETESASAVRIIDFVARSGGITLVAMALALSAIIWFPYRRGDRWAWWTAWLLPAWALAVLALNVATGVAPGQTLSEAAISAPIFAAVEAGVLLFDRPRFDDQRRR